MTHKMPEIHGLGEKGESARHNRKIDFAKKRTSRLTARQPYDLLTTFPDFGL